MNPNLWLLQLAAESLGWQDTQWATRIVLDDDGAARLLPLYPADVAAYCELMWDAELPTHYLWSVAP